MEKGKIYYDNMIGEAVLTASSSAAGFGIEYLTSANPGVVWRSEVSATGEEQVIQITYPSSTPINGIVVLNHNLLPTDTFRFEASTLVDFSDPGSIVSIDLAPSSGAVENLDWNYRYYRLRLQKAPDTYIQIGEIFLFASCYEFPRNFKWNYTYTQEINRNSNQTTSGQVYRKTRFIRKSFDLEFEGFTDNQKGTFEKIAENDYICFLPYGVPGDLYYGTVDVSTFTHVYHDYWSAALHFMENPQ